MTLTLLTIIAETPDVFTFVFQPPACSWLAGQFLEYYLPHDQADNRGQKRWFTNAAAPHEKTIHITTRISEPSSSFKQALMSMRPGDTIEASPPEGDFVVDNPDQQFVFIAGGIGITPFRAIISDLHMRGEPLNITLLYANRSPDNVVFKNELEQIVGLHPELDVHFIYSPRSITESLIRDLVPVLHEPLFYVSGPEPMVEAVGTLLLQSDVPKKHLKQDFFPNYSNFH